MPGGGRTIVFEHGGARYLAAGRGQCADRIARSLSRRLGVPVECGLGADRDELRARYVKGEVAHDDEVRVISEEAW